jgi:exonuclease III
MNVALLDIDVHDPAKLKRVAGFTGEERTEFRRFFEGEEPVFVDSFRKF